MTDQVEHLSCTSCRLADYRTQVVPGVGSLFARLALVGEAPGQQEDVEGRPFVGPAGTMLYSLLHRAGLKYEMKEHGVWITNAVHCRPPRNDLSAFPDALDTCPSVWLSGEGGELAARPNLKVIVALGQTAGALWFPGKKAHELAIMNTIDTQTHAGFSKHVVVVGAYHPSYALRQGAMIEDSIVASLERARRYLE